jgi:DNA-binding response OmpR family regulator
MPDGVEILIVEDDGDQLLALMAIVALDGYRVEGAASAKEALEIVSRHVPQCIVLDLGLPDGDGAELARQLRAAHGSGLVLIGVTGATEAATLAGAEAAGIDYVLSKPLDVERFRRIVPPTH